MAAGPGLPVRGLALAGPPALWLVAAGASGGSTAPGDDAACAAQEPREVWIPGGTFRFGTNHAYPEERPASEVTDARLLDRPA